MSAFELKCGEKDTVRGGNDKNDWTRAEERELDSSIEVAVLLFYNYRWRLDISHTGTSRVSTIDRLQQIRQVSE